MDNRKNLLNKPPVTISVGLEIFAETLQELGFPVVQVDWRPPAGGDRRLADLLNRLEQSKTPEEGYEGTGDTRLDDSI